MSGEPVYIALSKGTSQFREQGNIDTQKRVSTGIILNSIPLATNPNGALLLTWLVDQSNLPGRYGLLAGRFVPHIAHLCTHKLASLTVLRSECDIETVESS